MTAIRIDQFMGMAPRLSNRLLPNSAASIAQNARLLSGELRGIRTPTRIHRFTSGTTKNVKRIYKDDGTPVWLGLSEADSDIVKGPLVNDSYKRYYWTGQEAWPAYNSIDRIENGDVAYKLGMPTPTVAPTIGTTGGSGDIETRAYVYTYVNSWGEESAPSPVASYSGPQDATWNLTALPSTAPDQTNRLAATNKRIYRTVTGQATVAYYFVEEIALATTSYNDTSANATVVLNSLLQSFGWDLPPDDLSGLIAHPSGFLVGFVGPDLYFSERYRPHAWPTQYILSVEHDIVGLGIYNNMLAVLTKGQPYFMSGNRPDNMTPIKSQSAEPCLSKASIASTLQGVLYASPNGLVLYNETGPHVITKPIMSLEEWTDYSPTTMRAAQYGEQYLAYYNDINAIKYAPGEPLGIFVEIDKFDKIDNIVTDDTTGEVWLVRANDVYKWEPTDGAPLYYTWKSKVFDFTRPVNFGAFMIKSEGQTLNQLAEETALLTAYNANRIISDPPAQLNPINFTPIGAARSFYTNVGTDPAGIDEIPQIKYPLGGSPLFDLGFLVSSITQVTITIWADGREILTRKIESGTTYRMPSGFKAAAWQFQLVGNSNIYSLAIAETPRELESV